MSYGAIDHGPGDLFSASSMLSNAKRRLPSAEAAEAGVEDALDEVVAHSPLPSRNDMPGLLLPWLLFTMVVVPDSLLEESALAVFTMAVCIALAVGFLYYSRGAAWRIVAVVCLVAPAGAYAMGHYARGHYLNLSLLYERSPSYTNVLSTEMPAAYKDASQITFSGDSYADPSRSVGYRHMKDYCAAPIVSDEAAQVVGFWAVGIDCCAGRGSFNCGQAGKSAGAAHSGMVVMDAGAFAGDVPHYRSAVEMASAVYGLILPADPILIEWNTDAATTIRELKGDARLVCGMAILVFLLLVPTTACCFGIFQFPLTKRPKAKGWNPEQLQLMKFGPELMPRNYGAEFNHDLYQERCYWSGEVIHDYAFYLANTHIFLGVFLAHPAHKYGKPERLVLALVFSSLVIFTVAVFSTFVPTGASRAVFILADVIIFRSIMKLYHFRGKMVDEHSLRDSADSDDVGYYQCAFVSFLVVLAICACIGMAALMSSSSRATARKMSMGSDLASSVDALGYVLALELCFSIVAPFYIHAGSLAGRWSWGFFGRWVAERDFYEAAQKEMEEHLPDTRTP